MKSLEHYNELTSKFFLKKRITKEENKRLKNKYTKLVKVAQMFQQSEQSYLRKIQNLEQTLRIKEAQENILKNDIKTIQANLEVQSKMNKHMEGFIYSLTKGTSTSLFISI